MRFADNHCHLAPDTAAEQVTAARAAGVERLITVGTDLAQSAEMVDIASATDGVWATAGIHPHDARPFADLGTDGDRLVLDFNLAYNPSCSYDPRWACPLSPPANRLSIPVRAGERHVERY